MVEPLIVESYDFARRVYLARTLGGRQYHIPLTVYQGMRALARDHGETMWDLLTTDAEGVVATEEGPPRRVLAG